MLEITRTVGQGVVIGDDHKLFVQEIGSGFATLRLYCPIYDVLHPIQRDKPVRILLGDEPVMIHYMGGNRGQVRIGFDASRAVVINRIERQPK